MLTEQEKHIRTCKLCGAEMKEPLKVGDKIYMFCSPECKRGWDAGREDLRRLRQKDLE